MKMNMAKIFTTNSVAKPGMELPPGGFLLQRQSAGGSNGLVERASTTTNTTRRETPTAIKVSVDVDDQPSVTALVNP